MIVKKIPNPKKSASKAVRISELGKYIISPEVENGSEKCIHAGAFGFVFDDPAAQRMEMRALAEEAVRSKDPISHYVLSWQEGERPTPAQVDEAVRIFMDELGFVGHQVIYGLHDNTKNMHVHLMINRVHPETYKVILPNKGFDLKAGLRAVARIETVQGWRSQERALYEVAADGAVMRKGRTEQQQATRPTVEKRDRELRYGEKSAERIAQEVAAPIIRTARSWRELHAQLAAEGLRYERKGSGALVYVGDVPLKASNVHRAASLSAMQKRIGPFEPSNQEQPNVYFDHARTQKPHPRETGQGAGHGMRKLSECRVAVLGQHQENPRVLSLDARPGGRSAERMRRQAGGRGTGRASQPLRAHQPGWPEYIAARDAQRAGKAAATVELQKRHEAERVALFALQKVERAAALAGDWKGKGAERNAKASLLAVQQAAAKLEMQERQKTERAGLRARFRPLPSYAEWQEPGISGKLQDDERRRTREQQIAHRTRLLATTLRSLTADTHQITGHVTYKSAGQVMFRDSGKLIELLDPDSERAIAAALAVAQTKFGRNLTVHGSPAVRQRIVEVAVANNMHVRFVDPALEALREQLAVQRAAQIRRQNAKEGAQRRAFDVSHKVAQFEHPVQAPQESMPRAPALESSGGIDPRVSREALLAELRASGFQVVDRQLYVGPIVQIKDGFAVQRLGRGNVHIHALGQLDGRYVEGQTAEIKYNNAGRGQDRLQALNRGRAQGPERG